MTAFSGGGRPTSDVHDSMSSVAERPEHEVDSQRARPRPLDQIFPLRGDANRGREMQATWRSFCRDRASAVKSVLATGRKPPEIAYQLGELLHNHFRTRGVTLTSAELRRLVAELLTLYGPSVHSKPENQEKPEQEILSPEPPQEQAMVAFGGAPLDEPWPGDVPVPPKAVEKTVEPPQSPLVTVAPSVATVPPPATPAPIVPAPQSAASQDQQQEQPQPRPPEAKPSIQPPPREPAPFERLLGRALDLARKGLASRDRQAARTAVAEAIDSVAGEQERPLPTETRQRLVTETLSEMVGLGLMDRLWSDRSVQAIYINGPQSVFVERDGKLQPVSETFRSAAHLVELLSRLVGRPVNGMADFQLRDGSNGFVVFPPVAPEGPVLLLRRAEPGQATLERLTAIGMVDGLTVELLRMATRSRLNILLTGPNGAGKTALLAALARDLEGVGRVVTVARHRHFSWRAPSKVELGVSPVASFGTLITAAARLEPVLLVLDDVQAEDVGALSERLARGLPGTLASIRPEALSPELVRTADMMVRMDRGKDGLFRVVAVEDNLGAAVLSHDGTAVRRGTTAPVFSTLVQARGYGAALSQLLG